MSIGVLTFVLNPGIQFFSEIPRSGITRSCGSSIFNSFEKPVYCFPWQLHPFTFPWTGHKRYNFSTPSPTLIGFCSFDNSHPNKFRRYYLIAVLIYTSLMINDIEHHLFIYLSTICMSFEEKSLDLNEWIKKMGYRHIY